MIIRSAETKFLIVSFVFVLLLGIKTVASFVEQPVLDAPASYGRQPSSVMKSKRAVALEKTAEVVSNTGNLDFNCQKNSQKELAVKGAYLQIRGKGCAQSNQGDQVSIINKSNGYTAAVFPSGREEFQTDLIQLVEGQNQILIEYQNANGKKFQREVVVQSSHI